MLSDACRGRQAEKGSDPTHAGPRQCTALARKLGGVDGHSEPYSKLSYSSLTFEKIETIRHHSVLGISSIQVRPSPEAELKGPILSRLALLDKAFDSDAFSNRARQNELAGDSLQHVEHQEAKSLGVGLRTTA